MIVSGGEDLRELYERLSAVAPVVVLPYYGATWQDALRATAEAFGRERRAADLTRSVEARIAAVPPTAARSP
ncbi:hypothetical protein BJF78_04305 [Pseudonocardia sp. CNS-139]|nr:hypothetical protein BJF78_04305 [Pseudonocardia sp. CNS-139]